MSQAIRVIVLNSDEEVAPELRSALLAMDGVKIAAELDEISLLGRALDQFPAEAVLLHLDPNPEINIDLIAPVIEARKERVQAIAMTECRDAEMVMRAMRFGIREFLWKPFPIEKLEEVLRRIASEARASGRKVGKVLTVAGTSGGAGATHVAVNLAAELVAPQNGNGSVPAARVAIADLDFRLGQVAMQLDAQPAYTIAELCETAEQIDTPMLDRAMVKHPSGLHLLARPSDFQQAERITAGQCAGALAALQEHYDFVVVDLSARFATGSKSIFDMSDLVFVVFQMLVPSVRNTDRVLKELARAGYAGERIRLVCNRVGRESGYLSQSDVEATLKHKIDFLIPDDWKTSSSAINLGATLQTHAPKTKLRQSFQSIAASITGRAPLELAAEAAPEPQRKKLFSFLAPAAHR